MTSTRSARFTSEPGSAKQARDFVRATLQQPPAVPPATLDDVVLAVSELTTNAIHHGVGDSINVEIERSASSVTLIVTSALPVDAADPSLWERGMPTGSGGRGIAIVRAVSTGLTFRAAHSHVSVSCRFAV